MRNPGGYSISCDPVLGTTEHDMFTCGHCQRVTIVKPFCNPEDMGGRCYGCRRLICKACAAPQKEATCDVIEKKLERWEAAGRLLDAARG
jgi:hypothetical protein